MLDLLARQDLLELRASLVFLLLALREQLDQQVLQARLGLTLM